MAPKSPEDFEKMRAESRSNILQSALKLFAEEGYDNTSISQIARDAGISKGLVYNYFDSKQELLEQVVHKGLKLMPEIFEASDRKIDSSTLPNMLERFRKSLKNDRLFWKFYAELLLQFLRNRELLQQFDMLFNEFIELFIECMRQQNVTNPEIEGRKLAAMLDGVSLHYMFDDDYPIDDIFDDIIKTYVPHASHE